MLEAPQFLMLMSIWTPSEMAEEGKRKEWETEEKLSREKDAAKHRTEETLKSAKGTVTSNYEAAKDKVGRGRDEEL